MNNELTLDVGQANEFKLACRREGVTNAEIKRMCDEKGLLTRVVNVMRGYAEIKAIEHVVDCGNTDVVPQGYGWTVEEHKTDKVMKLERRGEDLYLDGKKIEFYLSRSQKPGKSIEGNKLRKELADKPVLNANVLDYLLKNPHLIPESWKTDENGNTRYIFFWGTIYRYSDGDLDVRYLDWDDGAWFWDFSWLGYDFDVYDPAAVSAS